jgi:hypothetical protein
MAYGFSATGNGGAFLLDSDLTATEHYAVQATGTCSDGGSVTKEAADLLFAKPNDTSTSTAKRVIYNGHPYSTSITFLKAVNYIILRKTQDRATSGNYGLQVKNPSGTVIYDSRTSTSGVKLLGSTPRATLGGSAQPNNPANYSISTQTTGNNHFTNQTASTVIHTGTGSSSISNVYVLVGAGFYSIDTTAATIIIGGAYYNYSADTILNESFTYIAPASSHTGYGNLYDITKGQLIT